MAAVKEKLGRIPCPNAGCGHSVWLKQNELGTLTVACDECDVNMIAKKGTGAAKKWRSLLPAAVQEPASISQDKPAKPEKPAAPAPASTVPSKVPSKVPSAPASVPPATKKPANPFALLGL